MEDNTTKGGNPEHVPWVGRLTVDFPGASETALLSNEKHFSHREQEGT